MEEQWVDLEGLGPVFAKVALIFSPPPPHRKRNDCIKELYTDVSQPWQVTQDAPPASPHFHFVSLCLLRYCTKCNKWRRGNGIGSWWRPRTCSHTLAAHVIFTSYSRKTFWMKKISSHTFFVAWMLYIRVPGPFSQVCFVPILKGSPFFSPASTAHYAATFIFFFFFSVGTKRMFYDHKI